MSVGAGNTAVDTALLGRRGDNRGTTQDLTEIIRLISDVEKIYLKYLKSNIMILS